TRPRGHVVACRAWLGGICAWLNYRRSPCQHRSCVLSTAAYSLSTECAKATMLAGSGDIISSLSSEISIKQIAGEGSPMKVSCLQENLHKGLQTVSKAVANKTTLPVLNNILISTDGGRLKLTATNLEVGITNWIGCQVEEEGAITVPAKLLVDFVSSLPNEHV